jgi:hypothetical protein
MRYIRGMRTTLSIDDDVLEAARDLAACERRSIGEVISELARRALSRAPEPASTLPSGVPLLPIQPNARPVTLEMIDRILDEEP